MKLCEYNIGKYLTNDYKYYEHVFCFILFRDVVSDAIFMGRYFYAYLSFLFFFVFFY